MVLLNKHNKKPAQPSYNKPAQQAGGFTPQGQQSGGFQQQGQQSGGFQQGQQQGGGFAQQGQQKSQQQAPKVNPQEPTIDFDDDIPF